MYAQDFLMFNRLLHLGFRSIALLLLLDEFLNFGSVEVCCVTSTASIFDVAILDDTLHLGPDVTICQVLVLKEQFWVFPAQRGIVKGILS